MAQSVVEGDTTMRTVPIGSPSSSVKGTPTIYVVLSVEVGQSLIETILLYLLLRQNRQRAVATQIEFLQLLSSQLVVISRRTREKEGKRAIHHVQRRDQLHQFRNDSHFRIAIQKIRMTCILENDGSVSQRDIQQPRIGRS